MVRASLLLALLGLCSLAAAQQNYTSLQPAAYTITLSYTALGVTDTPVPCNTTGCYPQVTVPDHDSITIAYSGPAGAAGNTISIMSCYVATYSKNRAWRKASPIISKDKQCNVAKPFKTGLPTGTGSFTWTPGPNTPGSVYFMQVLEVVAGSDPKTYAAMGRSVGNFQIIPIDSRPAWLMAMVGVFCSVGPIVLTGFFVWEKVLKKEK